jgi:hypothetical protein
MSDELIDHIGIVVPNLEVALKKLSALIGYTFSPIVRYKTDRYSDNSNRALHLHETRVSMSKEGPPYLEVMEVTGYGTHGLGEMGLHHLGLQRQDDIEARFDQCAERGFGDDGKSFLENGRLHLGFTAKADCYGVRFEFRSRFAGPAISDDGSPLPLDAVTGLPDWWAPRSARVEK